jgi:hypothetical protein
VNEPDLEHLQALRDEWDERDRDQRDDLLTLFLENAWPTKASQLQ